MAAVLHKVQALRHVRVAVIAAQVVHAATIHLVALLHSVVPSQGLRLIGVQLDIPTGSYTTSEKGEVLREECSGAVSSNQ